MSEPSFGLVIPAAGEGRRLAQSDRKAWVELQGQPILLRTIRAIRDVPGLAHVVVAVHSGDIARAKEALGGELSSFSVVAGGKRRQDSVLAGLLALPGEIEWAGVHDAARPYVSHELILRVFEGAQAHGAAIPGLPVSDTVKRVDAEGRIVETPARAALRAVQTPQFGRRGLLISALENCDSDVTDESQALELAGEPVFVVSGDPENRKITFAADLS